MVCVMLLRRPVEDSPLRLLLAVPRRHPLQLCRFDTIVRR
jgi:hypothetical protein